MCNFAARNGTKSMKKQRFTAQIVLDNGDALRASLEVVFFREHPYTIAYCPALDLSAAAVNQKAAKEEFAQIFSEYITDCMQNDTLRDDLLAHGWQLHNNAYQAPSMTQMLIGNHALQDIVDNKDYHKQVVSIPPISTVGAFA